MLAEITDIRIVAEPWTSDVFAAAALLVSLASVAYTVITHRSDRAHLRIQTSLAFATWTPGPPVILLAITVTNQGHTASTVLQHLHLRGGKDGMSIFLDTAVSASLPAFPVTLGPGESVSATVAAVQIANACATNRIDPQSLLVVARGGHGTKVIPVGKHQRDHIAGLLSPV